MNKIFKCLTALGVCAGLSLVSLCVSCKSEKQSYDDNSQKSETVHVHSYDESRWVSDDGFHWYAATCGHGVKKAYAAHAYDGDTDPDCNVCGRVREIKTEEELPKTTDIPVESPIVCVRLKAGKTSQISSDTDKMSAGWTFVGVRENGEAVDLADGDTVVGALDTVTVGVHTVTVSYGNITGEVEYEIFSVPEYVKGVDIRLKEIDTTVEEGAFELRTGHFGIDITADSEADIVQVNVVLVCGETAGKSLELLPQETPHVVTVRVAVYYEVEGDIILRTFEKGFEIAVNNAVIPEPDIQPEPDNGLVADGSVWSDWDGDIVGQTVLAESDKGAIFVSPQENFTAYVQISDGGALCVEYAGEGYDAFCGLGFETFGEVTVTLSFNVNQDVDVAIISGCYFDEWDFVTEPETVGDGGTMTFTVEKGGRYYFYFGVCESGARIDIGSLQLEFD